MRWTVVPSALAVSLCGAWMLSSQACAPSDADEQTAGVPASGSGGQAATPDSASRSATGMQAAASEAESAGAGGVGTAVDGAGRAGQSGAAGAVGAAGASTDAGAAGASGSAAPKDAGAAAPGLPPVTRVDGDGPFATSQDLASGPRGDSGLFYPTELGRDGLKHPIFVWGCGGGSDPSAYAEHMNRVASHGFVAIAAVSMIGDDDGVLSANLDWLLAENERPDSMLFGKLDPTKVAAGGHSIGSVNAFLFADDPRLTTTLHVAGSSLDDVHDPFATTTGLGGKALVHPTALISAETDVFGNVEKLEADYAAATAPVFLTRIGGADHVSATRDGLPLIVAWLRWQLGGETERSGMFLDPAGDSRPAARVDGG